MPDEQSSEEPSGNPNGEPLLRAEVISAIEKRVMALEAKSNPDEQKDPTKKLLGDVKQAEWWMIGVNAATLITTIIIACIYFHQLTEMRKATKATQNAVCVASKTLSQTQKSNAGQDILNRETIDATIESFRLDQRAWAGVSNVFPATLAINIPWVTTIEIKNTGKTPAKDVEIWQTIDMQAKGVTSTKKLKRISSNLVIQPNQTNHNDLGDPAGKQDAGLVKSLSEGTMIVWIRGKISYSDIFGIGHWTTYCFRSVSIDATGRETFTGCNFGNDVDRNPEHQEGTQRHPVTESQLEPPLDLCVK